MHTAMNVLHTKYRSVVKGYFVDILLPLKPIFGISGSICFVFLHSASDISIQCIRIRHSTDVVSDLVNVS